MNYLRLLQAKKIAKRHVKLLRARNYAFNSPDAEKTYMIQEQVSRKNKTLSRCSCWMCAHKREIEGPTYQELRLKPLGGLKEGYE